MIVVSITGRRLFRPNGLVFGVDTVRLSNRMSNARPTAAKQTALTGGHRVLVVDDNPDFGELVRRVAEKAGHTIAVTHHPDHFKTAFSDFRPDIICMDIVMPSEDGIELIRWLADQQSRAAIYIITGHSPSYARAAVEIGRSRGLDIAGVLQKPVTVATLREILSRARDGEGFAAAAN